MSLDGMLDKVYEVVDNYLEENAVDAKNSQLGLDDRAGWGLKVIRGEAIACKVQYDSKLQYYGGFEYVDKGCRRQVGEWVFYDYNDSRVASHLDRFDEECPDEDQDEE